jgi:hypothetical protein
LARLSPAAKRGLNDYLDCLEAEYDVRIEAHDLSDFIAGGLDQYQEKFDAIVLDFRDAVDEIEKRAFDACESIEEEDPTDADGRLDEALGDARDRILKESGRLAERLNSLNLRSSWQLSSLMPPSVNDGVSVLKAWSCADCSWEIKGEGQYEWHRTLYPDHHPRVSAEHVDLGVIG